MNEGKNNQAAAGQGDAAGSDQADATAAALESLRGQLAAALREKAEIENIHQAFTDAFDGYLYICSPDYRIEFMNRRLIERTGRDGTGGLCHDVLHHLPHRCPWCVNDRVMEGQTVRWELRSPKDQRWYYIVNAPFRHTDGRLSKLSIIMDITERKEMELALQESEQRYRRLLESVTDYVYEVDVRHGLATNTRHGPGCESVTGYTSAEFQNNPYLWLHMVPTEDRPQVIRQIEDVFAGRDPKPLEHRIVRRDGAIRWVRNTPVPHRDPTGLLLGYDGLVKDVTESHEAQEARLIMERRIMEAHERECLQRTDRMASLGLLAAGVAHEVNNPLQGMISHLSSVRDALPRDFPKAASLDMIEKGMETIAALVQRLLWLSTGPEKTDEQTLCHTAIQFVLNLLQSSFEKARIRIEVLPAPRPLAVAMAHRELVQVLLNLLINARDAMPEGGTLTISCQETETGPLCIRIADTGVGMSPEELANIFTPFYTSKGHHGTGLGLSVADSLVQANGGSISVESEKGAGSVFRVFLPGAPPVPSSSEPSPRSNP